jgi:Helicase conserved C-terminal domain/SNF2-related domain
MEGLFPEGRALSIKQWVISHGLSEYVLLRRLGFRVPNPITCYYDWCGGRPFSVQRVTCSLLTASPRAYVLNDMGTGKTRCALWAWDYLYGNGYAGKLLVSAKLSTLTRVWKREATSAIPHRKVVVLEGTKKQRLKRLSDPCADVFVINHDGMKVLQAELAQRPDIDVLLIDELAAYRNSNDRSKAMVKFAERMKFAWGMTGSPMPNEPTDVWMQCKILTPHTVPRFRSHARDLLMTKHGEYVYLPKPDAVERAYSWMQPAVRFTLDDVTELPEVVSRFIDVPMGPKQQRAYIEMKNLLLTTVNGDQITADNAAVAMNKLLQVSGGYVYASGKTIVLDADQRKQVLVDLIREATGKVLVFFPFRHMVTGLSEYLNQTKPNDPDYIDHAVIHGDVSTGMRNMIFSAFQDTPQLKAILAHPGCMSHGLTLTAADTVIWYCPITSLELYEQANARIRRVGQKHRQQVIHLQSTPVERRVYALLQKKARVQDMLLSLFAEATTQAQEGAIQEKYDGEEPNNPAGDFVPRDSGGNS